MCIRLEKKYLKGLGALLLLRFYHRACQRVNFVLCLHFCKLFNFYVLKGCNRNEQTDAAMGRPARAGRLVLLIVLLLAGLSACCGLKSMASESESKHKVRATLEAAMHSFEVQLANGQFKASDEEYALARALLER